LGRRFGRGPMDGAGGDRSRRARARHHAVAPDAFPLATDGVVRREGDCGTAQRVRRPRREEIMTTPVIAARPTTQVHAPAEATVRDKADPCTMVIFGALGDLSRRKLLPAMYSLMKEHLVDERFCVLGVGRDPREAT